MPLWERPAHFGGEENASCIACVEHPSVARTADALEAQGYEIVRLPGWAAERRRARKRASRGQLLSRDHPESSLMLVNNETGAIQPVAKAQRLYSPQRGTRAIAPHCDAAQAFGKLPFRVKRSRRRFDYAQRPQNTRPQRRWGFVPPAPGARILPEMHGGGQEGGLRSGTESVPF